MAKRQNAFAAEPLTELGSLHRVTVSRRSADRASAQPVATTCVGRLVFGGEKARLSEAAEIAEHA
jgi:hypothetical protein